MSRKFYSEVIAEIREKRPDEKQLSELKKRLGKKHGMKKIPSNIEIVLHGSGKDLKDLRLVTKPTRTLSGVATISVMTAPAGCPHGRCTFCPGGPNSAFGDVPQSYTGREPATMRAIRNRFDPYMQVFSRLEQYAVMGQAFDKVEVIVQGGTFPSMDESYQNVFAAGIYKAMNDFSAEFFKGEELDLDKFRRFFELPGDYRNEGRAERVRERMTLLKGSEPSLADEQERNEKARIRCVGLTIETKPDWGFLEHGNQMLNLGCTRVELGIQTVYEKGLKLTNRGHDISDTLKSVQILKDLGFKINAHYMLGLPGVKREDEIPGLKKLFEDPGFKPDMLKIYPLLVIKGTPLFIQWQRGQYQPITTQEAAEIISEAKRFFPKWVRIMRVNRDIPTYVTSAGIDRTNLRQYVKELQEAKGIECNCIRCREAGRSRNFETAEVTVTEYEASGSREFFIAAEDAKNNVLLGFCRLRFPLQHLREEITKDAAIVRELHVYAAAVAVGRKADGQQVQHRGYGRKLMEKAEEIAKQNGRRKMLVISGIGTREYYRKLGYSKDGVYMGKKIA